MHATKRRLAVNAGGYVVGEAHHRAKLTDHEVNLCLQLFAEGMSKAEIARKMEVAPSTVHDYVSARRRAQPASGIDPATLAARRADRTRRLKAARGAKRRATCRDA